MLKNNVFKSVLGFGVVSVACAGQMASTEDGVEETASAVTHAYTVTARGVEPAVAMALVKTQLIEKSNDCRERLVKYIIKKFPKIRPVPKPCPQNGNAWRVGVGHEPPKPPPIKEERWYWSCGGKNGVQLALRIELESAAAGSPAPEAAPIATIDGATYTMEGGAKGDGTWSYKVDVPLAKLPCVKGATSGSGCVSSSVASVGVDYRAVVERCGRVTVADATARDFGGAFAVSESR